MGNSAKHVGLLGGEATGLLVQEVVRAEGPRPEAARGREGEIDETWTRQTERSEHRNYPERSSNHPPRRGNRAARMRELMGAWWAPTLMKGSMSPTAGM